MQTKKSEVCALRAGARKSKMFGPTGVDRRGAVPHGPPRRRSPRPSDSCATVDIPPQRTYRKSIPVSTDHRIHTSTAAVVTSAATSAAAVASAGRVDRLRLAHPSAEQMGASRTPSPATAAANRPAARSNRSSDLRLARRDTAVASRPLGQLVSGRKPPPHQQARPTISSPHQKTYDSAISLPTKSQSLSPAGRAHKTQSPVPSIAVSMPSIFSACSRSGPHPTRSASSPSRQSFCPTPPPLPASTSRPIINRFTAGRGAGRPGEVAGLSERTKTYTSVKTAVRVTADNPTSLSRIPISSKLHKAIAEEVCQQSGSECVMVKSLRRLTGRVHQRIDSVAARITERGYRAVLGAKDSVDEQLTLALSSLLQCDYYLRGVETNLSLGL